MIRQLNEHLTHRDFANRREAVELTVVRIAGTQFQTWMWALEDGKSLTRFAAVLLSRGKRATSTNPIHVLLVHEVRPSACG